MQSLRGKQKAYLRGRAHELKPIVIVGHRGLTEAVVHQVDGALEDHELIKIKVSKDSPTDRNEVGELLASQVGCEVAGAIGHILIIYRRREENPKIQIPED